MQHYVLSSLSRADMFSEAILHGGTCLRIVHGMSRFSEDLDILLKRPDPAFCWAGYLTFPVTAALTTQSLPSGFATTAHALLCRQYVKGRDWYDFLWYASRKIKPDLQPLRNALLQRGPWAGQVLEITRDWSCDRMAAAIRRVDWREARLGVQRFVPAAEQAGLDHWGAEFFLYQLEQVRRILLEAHQLGFREPELTSDTRFTIAAQL